MFIASLEYVGTSWSMLEGSREAGGLNAVFVLKTAIPAMAVMLFLQGFSLILHSVLIISDKEAAHAAPDSPDHEL